MRPLDDEREEPFELLFDAVELRPDDLAEDFFAVEPPDDLRADAGLLEDDLADDFFAVFEFPPEERFAERDLPAEDDFFAPVDLLPDEDFLAAVDLLLDEDFFAAVDLLAVEGFFAAVDLLPVEDFFAAPDFDDLAVELPLEAEADLDAELAVDFLAPPFDDEALFAAVDFFFVVAMYSP
jgi:hypothetical protein